VVLSSWVLSPFAPVAFGFAVGVLVFGFRSLRGLKRDIQYLTIFMNAASIYVFCVMVFIHKWFGVPYSLILDNGFGLEETTVAFIFSMYHFSREILKMATDQNGLSS